MANAYIRHDISDESWAKIELLLPGRKGIWGGNARDNRQFINAIFWILRTGAPWRDLPPSYGDWKNTHRRFCRWRDKEVWENLLVELIDNPEFELFMIDASHIKVHPHGRRRARGGNQDMAKTKGGSTPRYIWLWMRMGCRSESLLQKVPQRIVNKLKPWLMALRRSFYWQTEATIRMQLLKKQRTREWKLLFLHVKIARFSVIMIKNYINCGTGLKTHFWHWNVGVESQLDIPRIRHHFLRRYKSGALLLGF